MGKIELSNVINMKLPMFVDNRGKIIKEYSSELKNMYNYEMSITESILIYNKKYVLRGLHFKKNRSQSKIVRCILGRVWAVVVDINPASKDFGNWQEVDINDGNAVYIPGDYALGILSLEDTIVSCQYEENDKSDCDIGIQWNDPTIGIKWPIENIDEIIVSEKDKSAMNFLNYKEKINERR